MESKSNKFRKFKSAIYSNIPFVAMLLVFIVAIVFFMRLTQIKSARKKAETEEIAKTAMQKRINVEVIRLKPTEVVDAITLPGIVEPWERVTIKAEVTGRITEILKDEGDFVRKGEVIAKVDNRDYIAAVKEAKANVDRRESDLDRNKALYKKKIISQSKYDSIVAPALAADAALDKASLNLERTEIRASFDGVINKRYIQLGTLVSPGTPITDVLDIQKVRVNIFIPERDVLQVTELEETDIILTKNRDLTVKGKKIFLSQEPAAGAQAYKLQFEVENKDGMLRPGMFVESDIVRGIKNNVLMLPIYSVLPVGDRAFCYVEEDGVARVREIQTGIVDNDMVEITSGITQSDNVITKGQRQLEDGELVEVVKSL